jgi:hypothetical protein
MAKPRVVTDLRVWMIETGRTDGDVAREISAKVPDKPITDRQVGRWRKGLAVPRYPEHLAELEKLSNRRVTASSFVQARLTEPPKEEPD